MSFARSLIACILVVVVGVGLYSIRDMAVDGIDMLIFHAERYHGRGKNKDFFEGWYFKMVSNNEKNSLVVIVGIFYSNDSDSPKSHSFIMTIVDGKTSSKYNFRVDQFEASNSTFSVKIGNNLFSSNGVSLDLVPKPGDDATQSFKGQLKFQEMVRWPVTLTAPGVMGWYSYVPTLECWHGVLSMHHKVFGTVDINNEAIVFDGGKGYIEKDWGNTFPKTWIWLQSNHFTSNPDTSIFLSIASVPWKGYSFPGFLVGLYHHHHLQIFTTWSGASFNITKYKGTTAEMVAGDSDYKLVVSVHDLTDGVLLYGPRGGEMVPFVRESVTCQIKVKLESKKTGEVLLDDVGNFGGCEFVGDIEWMVKNL